MTSAQTGRIRREPAVSFAAYGGSAPENYERYFVPAIGRPLAEDLVRRASLRPGERVIDIACGTGIVARLAADRVGPDGSVTGADLNGGMLAVARSAAVAGRITWREADASSLPFDDHAFDVVVSQLGLQFFANRPAALREMHRVLAPGGRALVSVTGPMPPLFAVLDTTLARHVSSDVARFMQSVFSLHEPSVLERLLGEAGFSAIEARADTRTLRLPTPRDFLWQYVHSTPLVAALANLDDDQRTALEREVVSGWQPFADRDGMMLELPMTIVSGRK